MHLVNCNISVLLELVRHLEAFLQVDLDEIDDLSLVLMTNKHMSSKVQPILISGARLSCAPPETQLWSLTLLQLVSLPARVFYTVMILKISFLWLYHSTESAANEARKSNNEKGVLLDAKMLT